MSSPDFVLPETYESYAAQFRDMLTIRRTYRETVYPAHVERVMDGAPPVNKSTPKERTEYFSRHYVPDDMTLLTSVALLNVFGPHKGEVEELLDLYLKVQKTPVQKFRQPQRPWTIAHPFIEPFREPARQAAYDRAMEWADATLQGLDAHGGSIDALIQSRWRHTKTTETFQHFEALTARSIGFQRRAIARLTRQEKGRAARCPEAVHAWATTIGNVQVRLFDRFLGNFSKDIMTKAKKPHHTQDFPAVADIRLSDACVSTWDYMRLSVLRVNDEVEEWVGDNTTMAITSKGTLLSRFGWRRLREW